MIKFLVAQITYSEIKIGLFQDKNLIDSLSLPKHDASAHLAKKIIELLKKHHLSCTNLEFIGSNQGPAPFTTLRVLMATLNGLAFSNNIPMVGIDGLKAFLTFVEDKQFPQTIILLNAFNKDFYYAYKDKGKIITGWKNGEKLLEEIKKLMPTGIIRFFGNGSTLFSSKITDIFGKRAILKPTPEYAPLNTIATLALKEFEKGTITKQLKPIYLKSIN